MRTRPVFVSHVFVSLAALALASCGGGTAGKPMSELDDKALAQLADKGDFEAKNEIARRAVSVAEKATTDKAATDRVKFIADYEAVKTDDAKVDDLADAGNPWALNARGQRLLKAEEQWLKNQGQNDLDAAAQGGNPDAQMYVGWRMAHGIEGYTNQPASGINMVKKAAEQGNAEAMYTVGVLYHEPGPMHDLKLAREWYQKAADAKFEGAKEALEKLGADEAVPM